MTPPPLPCEDLRRIAEDAWSSLARAAADPGAAFRRMQVATLGPAGGPEVRTVILRGADAGARQVAFHTDRRSAKAAEIADDARVALHLWDTGAEVQLRLRGEARIAAGDNAPEADWRTLSELQKRVYAAPCPPGMPLTEPSLGYLPEEADGGSARQNFAVVTVRVSRFDWLHLRPGGHRRARFEWQDGWQGRWIAP